MEKLELFKKILEFTKEKTYNALNLNAEVLLKKKLFQIDQASFVIIVKNINYSSSIWIHAF